MAEKKERRPFASAAELAAACEAYFAACDQAGKLYGEAGLALHLGVTLVSLRRWYDGKRSPDFQETIQRAYLRIQDQIETSPAYMEKGGMATKAIFLLKQARLGGYQDKVEARQDLSVHVKLGSGMEDSDFK